jgi:hypothetical protein
MTSRRISPVLYSTVEGAQISDLILSPYQIQPIWAHAFFLHQQLYRVGISPCATLHVSGIHVLQSIPIGFFWKKNYSKVGTNYVVSSLDLTEHWIERSTKKSIPSW